MMKDIATFVIVLLALLLHSGATVFQSTLNLFKNPYLRPFLRPYGPQSFVNPTGVPDLPSADPVIPVNYRNFKKGQKDCDLFIFQAKRLINSATLPNPPIWFNNGVTSNNTLAQSLFNQNVNIRINPLGIFPGFVLAIQYYYALTTYWFTIKKGIVHHMTCTGNVVSFKLTMESPLGYNTSQWNVVQFDPQGKIITLDAMFYNLGALSDKSVWTPQGFIPLINTGATQNISYKALDNSTVTLSAGNYTYNVEKIYMICQVTALGYSSLSPNTMNIPGGTCQGQNAIWNNTFGLSQFDYCMNWLQKEVPFGSWNWGNQNNTICRLVHMQLTYFDPDAHCPHVGFGGSFCKNFPYDYFFPPGGPSPFEVGNPVTFTDY